MRTLRTVAELRAALRPARRSGETIGLVPTMGALHDGHLSLLRRARAECDLVVISLFVNPAQFDEPADLQAYPRDEARDIALAAESGADLAFAPEVSEVYHQGFCTSVSVSGLSETLEGSVRGAEHFRAVSTVVTKLLNMVGPEVAYFGQKDAQQAAVIRRLVSDLDLPVRVAICPTVREADGLALSSRNARLSADERARAVSVAQGLRAAEQRAREGERDGAVLLGAARAALVAADVRPEYLALVDCDTLAPLRRLQGRALLVVAVRLGETRLIDNVLLEPLVSPPEALPPARRDTRPAAFSRPETEPRCIA